MLRRIETTACSEVYECVDPDLKRRVAVKLFDVKDRLLEMLPYSREQWRVRFLREARLLGQIDNPYVVPVLDLARHDDEPFYVMPFVKTTLLREMGGGGDVDEPSARTYPMPLARTILVLSQIAQGLHAFHARGLVHRDLKPRNILLTKRVTGIVKLCDPGVAKFPGGGGSVEEYWLGVREYIPPEQQEDASSVEPSADIYAVGVIAHKMLSGDLPPVEPEDIGFPGADVPDGLVDLIRAALSPDKALRPQDAREFFARLQRITV
ncbi:MAG: serine/threonine protein kinase [Alphaproteobacteria bacterium]|nr:serine/threonine protein kinase [Alphaproteobacteria bacterium]